MIWARSLACRLGEDFKPDEHKGFGFSSVRIDAIMAGIDWCRTMETSYRLRLKRLDRESTAQPDDNRLI